MSFHYFQNCMGMSIFQIFFVVVSTEGQIIRVCCCCCCCCFFRFTFRATMLPSNWKKCSHARQKCYLSRTAERNSTLWMILHQIVTPRITLTFREKLKNNNLTGRVVRGYELIKPFPNFLMPKTEWQKTWATIQVCPPTDT